MPNKLHVLFVTWDGPGSAYLESLFLPIFKILAKRGIVFHVIQFTWANKDERRDLEKSFEACGFTYEAVSVLRWPLSAGSLITAFLGAFYIRQLIKKLEIDVVVSRSTLPAVSSIFALHSYPHVGLIFDADGLPHDERVDFGGMSSKSISYRVLRDLEAYAVRSATAVLTRSKKAIDILVARSGAGVNLDKFYLVTNGRDEKFFRPAKPDERRAVRHDLGIDDDAPMLVYVGSSLQGKYCGQEMLEFFKAVHARRKDAHLLLLTSKPDEAGTLLNKYEEISSFCHIKHVLPEKVPEFLGACDLGLVLIHPKFSMQAVAPIKLGEYLLCGLPVLATAGIGDEEVIPGDAGLLLKKMDSCELKAAADWFIDSVLPQRENYRVSSRAVGLKRFSVESSALSYRNALQYLNFDL